MTIMRPGVPVSVPQSATGGTAGAPGATPGAAGTTGTSDVTIGVTSDTKELDARPDARANPPGAAPVSHTAAVANPTSKADVVMAPQQPFATNHPLSDADKKKYMKQAQEKAKREKKAAAKAAKKGQPRRRQRRNPPRRRRPRSSPRCRRPRRRSPSANGTHSARR